jgi:hypothetical protein
MRNTRLRTALTVLVLGSVSPLLSGTQARPNFTGTWKQNNQLTTPIGVTDRIYTETIDHVDPILKVRVSVESGPMRFIDDRTYTTDGRPQSSTAGTRERTTTAAWEGVELVVETVERATTGGVTITREKWVLSPDGRTLTKMRNVRGPDGETDARMVLEKQ